MTWLFGGYFQSGKNRLSYISDTEKERIVIMGDKGVNTTKITLMLPDRKPTPQSCYNHLILATWEGNDNNGNLLKCKNIIDLLVPLNVQIFVGGDLSFLAS